MSQLAVDKPIEVHEARWVVIKPVRESIAEASGCLRWAVQFAYRPTAHGQDSGSLLKKNSVGFREAIETISGTKKPNCRFMRE